MENKLRDVSPQVKETSSPTIGKGLTPISLPFTVKALVVCEDEQVESALYDLLSTVKNLEVQIEHKLNFVTQEFLISVVVYTGNDTQTSIDIEKISNAGANIILIGDNLPQSLMRKSLKLSIKDFIPLETAELELLPAIQNLASQLTSNAKVASVVSVLNGKGGSGASFITNSLAQIISNNCEGDIALFDGDLQHGSLADSLNFKPKYFLDDALNDLKDLDSTAIKSMMSKRKNLSLLPVKAYSQLNSLSHIDQNKINQLLGKIRLSYKLFIADLSRGLDSLSIPIVEASDDIFIVVQQNIVSIREAKALVEQLKYTMGISSDKLHLIVNRYSEKFSTITFDDMQKTIGLDSVFKISNDYQLASACTDLGKPLEELSDTKNIEQDLIKIIEKAIPLEIEFNHKANSFWSKITGSK